MSRSAIRTSALALALALGRAPAHAQRPAQGDDDSAALVDEGRAALKRRALDDAASALDQAIALNPRRVEAYVLRSAVYAERKQYQEGVRLMRRAQALAPADEDVVAALGSYLVLSGDTGAGVPLLEQVVAKDPARYGAELLLGHHWYAAGKWGDAITAFEAYFAHRPRDLASEDRPHRIDLADAYLRDRQAHKALGLFRHVADEGTPDLRVRFGVAWATAAIDCRRAQPLLRELEPVADAHPEAWLVEGQCALALDDTVTALERGQRYLHARPGAASGHALVGEVYASRGNLVEARHAFETARALDPERRRWPVRLAVVLRRLGDASGALAVLETLGPPASATRDADWWIELGRVLIASGDWQAVVARLTPIVAELPASTAIRVMLGAAQLVTGQAEAAARTFQDAEAIARNRQTESRFADELATLAGARLTAGDAAVAEPMLARAAGLAESAAILRDLGIARLAINRPGDALTTLDRAIALEPAPITLLLEARAFFLFTGDIAGARQRYDRAEAALDPRHPDAVELAAELAIDRAASELAGGDPARAVTAFERLERFEKLAKRVTAGSLAARRRVALAQAQHAQGIAALRAGDGGKAVELLTSSLQASPADSPDLTTLCDLALAAVVSGDPPAALKALGEVKGQRCPFPAPADLQAVPILIAFTEALHPRQAGRSLEQLTALAGTHGLAAVLHGTAMRAVALEAAEDAYRAGNLAKTRAFMATAKRANTRIGSDELTYDLTLLDLVDETLFDGKLDAAIGTLERLAPKLPEALVTLGIVYERKGLPEKALEAWRRARKAGSRFAMLAEWIAAKERIYGEPP